jgi:hypothetical protein
MNARIIKPGQVVFIAERNGDDVSTHPALVLAVEPGADENGNPNLETVNVNPAMLHHAGTSDFQNAIMHRNGVPHVSHPDFVSGKVSAAYQTLLPSCNDDADADAPLLCAAAPGELTEQGKRWEELHRIASHAAMDQFEKEYPDPAIPPTLPDGAVQPVGHGLAADPEAPESPEKIVDMPEAAVAAVVPEEESTEAPEEVSQGYMQPEGTAEAPVYALYVDGVQKGPDVTAEAIIKKDDGSITPVSCLVVGDVLENGIIVIAVGPASEGNLIEIHTEHSPI